MEQLYIIPDDLIFSPCKVDGNFWKTFHVLLSYLGQPEELIKLKQDSPEKYEDIVSCLLLFISETEKELFDKGKLTTIALDPLTRN
jgi:hypothetical protein